MSESELDAVMRIIVMGIGAFFTLGGLALCVHAFVQHRRVTQSPTWPTTIGRVVSSSVTSTIAGPGINYLPRVRYEYMVSDQRYKGDKLFFFPRVIPSRKAAKSQADDYPVGKELVVYYSPNKPSLSVIHPGRPNQASRYFTWGLGLFLLAAGLSLFLLML